MSARIRIELALAAILLAVGLFVSVKVEKSALEATTPLPAGVVECRHNECGDPFRP